MAFAPAFSAPFRRPLGGDAAAAALPWWNIDGMTPGSVGGSCVAAYQPKAGGLYFPANIAESYINRANPGTYDAAPGVAPAWGALLGWVFNGTTEYLKTGIIPVYQTWSALIQFNSVDPAGNGILLGSGEGWATDMFIMSPRLFPISSFECVYASDGRLIVAPPLADGNLAIAGNIAYRNGSPEGVLDNFGNVLISECYIGCVNLGGAILHLGATVAGLALYSVALSAPQVLARATAMAAI